MPERQVEAIYPLTPAQQGMLFDSVRSPDRGLHIEQLSCSLEGVLDLAAFRQAWQALVERHSVLRTAFVWKEQQEPVQVVLREAALPIQVEDWRGLSGAERNVRLRTYRERDRLTPFPLTRPPLIRIALFRTGDRRHRLVFTHHHILMDGWCQSILLHECVAFYESFRGGTRSPLPSCRPYGDYVTWLARQDRGAAETFWRTTFAGFRRPTPPGALRPGERPPDTPTGFGALEASLDRSVGRGLQALARQHRLTLSTVVQGAWSIVLSRYHGTDDVVFGVTVSGRPAELPGIESTVGLFINTLPVRARVTPGRSFWEWLQDLQRYNLELSRFEYSAGGDVHAWSGLPGGLPLFESLLVFENYPSSGGAPASTSPGLAVRRVESQGARTQYPLTLLVAAEADLTIRLVFDRGRLDDASAALVLRDLVVALEAASDAHVRIGSLVDQVALVEVPRLWPAGRGRPRDGHAAAPATPTERRLAAIWSELLGVEPVGRDDDFFELGGHSQVLVRLVARIRQDLGVELPLGSVVETPSLAKLAACIDAAPASEPARGRWSPVVPLQRLGGAPPFFCAHPINGQVLCYLPLAGHLVPDQPLYGLQAADEVRQVEETSIEEMAAEYVQAMLAIQPEGPYRVGGWSLGGLIAFEMASQLHRQGAEVSLLALIDTRLPWGGGDPEDEDDDFAAVLHLFPPALTVELRQRLATRGRLRSLLMEQRLAEVRDELRTAGLLPEGASLAWIRRIQLGYRARMRAVRRYRPTPYDGRITLFRGREAQDETGLGAFSPEQRRLLEDPAFGWGSLSWEPIDVLVVPGDHDSVVAEPHVAVLAERLRECLDRVAAPASV